MPFRVPFPNGTMNYFNNVNNELIEWRMLVKLGMFRIQPKMLESIMAEYNQLISKNDRVLGVKLRGTDYTATQPYQHAIQPPIDLAVNTIRTLKAQWQCNKIFLATEDKNIFLRCKEEFGDDCITSEMAYADYGGQGVINDYNVDRENSLYLKGKEYLTQMVILSKCKDLLLSNCSGSVGLMMMHEGIEHCVVFNLGLYGVHTPSPPPIVSLITCQCYKLKTPSLRSAAEFFFCLSICRRLRADHSSTR